LKKLIFAILVVTAAWLAATKLRRGKGDRALDEIAAEARLTLEHFNRS
jgi:hypothetical protein